MDPAWARDMCSMRTGRSSLLLQAMGCLGAEAWKDRRPNGDAKGGQEGRGKAPRRTDLGWYASDSGSGASVCCRLIVDRNWRTRTGARRSQEPDHCLRGIGLRLLFGWRPVNRDDPKFLKFRERMGPDARRFSNCVRWVNSRASSIVNSTPPIPLKQGELQWADVGFGDDGK